jgi:hypothetical protein
MVSGRVAAVAVVYRYIQPAFLVAAVAAVYRCIPPAFLVATVAVVQLQLLQWCIAVSHRLVFRAHKVCVRESVKTTRPSGLIY